ncbi:hypothetical protein PPERSA_12493 [Pseudocohnilembus persalinus]|uniref:Uncharacterized protein n=1 Tax=Pseudocohnilembus persalinus TaxID=266149 RepID=A0A0V0QP45_PSEPJ|nr:hypothetical protein PPERSA_12493 [Pseudocohnilembus persalinus]|eukprot:KRX04046.1 hypothetical protein PPERSA_12493 [Pseudocohnilembus persalinus]
MKSSQNIQKEPKHVSNFNIKTSMIGDQSNNIYKDNMEIKGQQLLSSLNNIEKYKPKQRHYKQKNTNILNSIQSSINFNHKKQFSNIDFKPQFYDANQITDKNLYSLQNDNKSVSSWQMECQKLQIQKEIESKLEKQKEAKQQKLRQQQDQNSKNDLYKQLEDLETQIIRRKDSTNHLLNSKVNPYSFKQDEDRLSACLKDLDNMMEVINERQRHTHRSMSTQASQISVNKQSFVQQKYDLSNNFSFKPKEEIFQMQEETRQQNKDLQNSQIIDQQKKDKQNLHNLNEVNLENSIKYKQEVGDIVQFYLKQSSNQNDQK